MRESRWGSDVASGLQCQHADVTEGGCQAPNVCRVPGGDDGGFELESRRDDERIDGVGG